jgi:hypothetical protein
VQALWRNKAGDGQHLLRKLCHLPTSLEGLCGGVVWSLLSTS